MLEMMLEVFLIPLFVGASVGSMYFLAAHHGRYEKKWVMIVMFITTWIIGFGAGLPLSDTSIALIVSLFSSAIGVVTLDAINVSTMEGKSPPPIINTLIEIVKAIRGK